MGLHIFKFHSLFLIREGINFLQEHYGFSKRIPNSLLKKRELSVDYL